MELLNGCICCMVVDDFIFIMEKLLECEDKLDYIVIEIFGFVLLQLLVCVFNWFGILIKVIVDGVVIVVDGKVVIEGCFVYNVVVVDV